MTVSFEISTLGNNGNELVYNGVLLIGINTALLGT
jgi:hypothetical protein